MKTFKLLPLISVLALTISACTPANTDTDNMAGEQNSSVETEGVVIDDENSSNDNDDMMESDTEDDAPKTEDAGGNGQAEKPLPVPARVIAITADNFAFTPSTMTVKKGEEVTLKITGMAGTHGFSIPDLGINVSVSPGQTVSVALPTDKAGTFGFMCSIPCGGGHSEMKGTITIQ